MSSSFSSRKLPLVIEITGAREFNQFWQQLETITGKVSTQTNLLAQGINRLNNALTQTSVSNLKKMTEDLSAMFKVASVSNLRDLHGFAQSVRALSRVLKDIGTIDFRELRLSGISQFLAAVKDMSDIRIDTRLSRRIKTIRTFAAAMTALSRSVARYGEENTAKGIINAGRMMEEFVKAASRMAVGNKNLAAFKTVANAVRSLATGLKRLTEVDFTKLSLGGFQQFVTQLATSMAAFGKIQGGSSIRATLAFVKDLGTVMDQLESAIPRIKEFGKTSFLGRGGNMTALKKFFKELGSVFRSLGNVGNIGKLTGLGDLFAAIDYLTRFDFDRLDSLLAKSGRFKPSNLTRFLNVIKQIVKAIAPLALIQQPAALAGIRHTIEAMVDAIGWVVRSQADLEKITSGRKLFTRGSSLQKMVGAIRDIAKALSAFDSIKKPESLTAATGALKAIIDTLERLSLDMIKVDDLLRKQYKFKFISFGKSQIQKFSQVLRELATGLSSFDKIKEPRNLEAASRALRGISKFLDTLAAIDKPLVQKTGILRRDSGLLADATKSISKMFKEIGKIKPVKANVLSTIDSAAGLFSSVTKLLNLATKDIPKKKDGTAVYKDVTERMAEFFSAIAKAMPTLVDALRGFGKIDRKSLAAVAEFMAVLPQLVKSSADMEMDARYPSTEAVKSFGDFLVAISKELGRIKNIRIPKNIEKLAAIAPLLREFKDLNLGDLGGMRGGRGPFVLPDLGGVINKFTSSIASAAGRIRGPIQTIGRTFTTAMQTVYTALKNAGTKIGSVLVSSFKTGFRSLTVALPGMIGQITRTIQQHFERTIQSIRTLGRDMQRIGTTFMRSGLTMLTTGGLGGFIQGRAASMVADFESMMKQIEVLGGVVGDQLTQSRQFILSLGESSVFTASQVAAAFLDLTKSGLSVKDTMGALPPIMDLAAAGQVEVADAAGLVIAALKNYNLGVEESSRVANAFVAGANVSRAEVAGLAQAFGYAAPQASALKVSLEQLVAMMAYLTDRGVETERIGTTLRQLFSTIAAPTNEAAEAMDELGLSFYDASGNLRTMEEIFADINEKIIRNTKLTEEQQNAYLDAIGGAANSASAMRILSTQLDDGTVAFSEYQKAMESAAPAATVAATLMDTFKGAVEELGGAVQTLLLKAITPLMQKVLRPMIEMFTAGVRAISQLPEPVLAAAAAVVALGTALITLTGAGMLITGVLLAPLGALVSVIGGLFTVLAHPLIAITTLSALQAGFVALSAAGAAFLVVATGIGESFRRMVQAVKAANAVGVFDGVKESFSQLVISVRGLFGSLSEIGRIMLDLILGPIDTIDIALGQSGLAAKIKVTADVLTAFLDSVRDKLKPLRDVARAFQNFALIRHMQELGYSTAAINKQWELLELKVSRSKILGRLFGVEGHLRTPLIKAYFYSFENGIRRIRSALSALGAAPLQLLTDLLQGKGFTESFERFVTKALESTSRIIGEFIAAGAQLLGKDASWLVNPLRDGSLPALRGLAAEFGVKLVEMFIKSVYGGTKLLAQAGAVLVDALFGTSFTAHLSQTLRSLDRFVSATSALIITLFDVIFDAFNLEGKGGKGGIASYLYEIIDQLGYGIDFLTTRVIKPLNTALQGLRGGGAASVIAGIVKSLQSLVKTVRTGDVADAFNWAVRGVRDLVKELLVLFGVLEKPIKLESDGGESFLTRQLRLLRDGLRKQLSALDFTGIGRTILNAIWSGIKAVGSLLTVPLGAAFDFVTGTDWIEIGRKIINALWHGIQDAWGTVSYAINVVFDWIIPDTLGDSLSNILSGETGTSVGEDFATSFENTVQVVVDLARILSFSDEDVLVEFEQSVQRLAGNIERIIDTYLFPSEEKRLSASPRTLSEMMDPNFGKDTTKIDSASAAIRTLGAAVDFLGRSVRRIGTYLFRFTTNLNNLISTVAEIDAKDVNLAAIARGMLLLGAAWKGLAAISAAKTLLASLSLQNLTLSLSKLVSLPLVKFALIYVGINGLVRALVPLIEVLEDIGNLDIKEGLNDIFGKDGVIYSFFLGVGEAMESVPVLGDWLDRRFGAEGVEGTLQKTWTVISAILINAQQWIIDLAGAISWHLRNAFGSLGHELDKAVTGVLRAIKHLPGVVKDLMGISDAELDAAIAGFQHDIDTYRLQEKFEQAIEESLAGGAVDLLPAIEDALGMGLDQLSPDQFDELIRNTDYGLMEKLRNTFVDTLFNRDWGTPDATALDGLTEYIGLSLSTDEMRRGLEFKFKQITALGNDLATEASAQLLAGIAAADVSSISEEGRRQLKALIKEPIDAIMADPNLTEIELAQLRDIQLQLLQNPAMRFIYPQDFQEFLSEQFGTGLVKEIQTEGGLEYAIEEPFNLTLRAAVMALDFDRSAMKAPEEALQELIDQYGPTQVYDLLVPLQAAPRMETDEQRAYFDQVAQLFGEMYGVMPAYIEERLQPVEPEIEVKPNVVLSSGYTADEILEAVTNATEDLRFGTGGVPSEEQVIDLDIYAKANILLREIKTPPEGFTAAQLEEIRRQFQMVDPTFDYQFELKPEPVVAEVLQPYKFEIPVEPEAVLDSGATAAEIDKAMLQIQQDYAAGVVGEQTTPSIDIAFDVIAELGDLEQPPPGVTEAQFSDWIAIIQRWIDTEWEPKFNRGGGKGAGLQMRVSPEARLEFRVAEQDVDIAPVTAATDEIQASADESRESIVYNMAQIIVTLTTTTFAGATLYRGLATAVQQASSQIRQSISTVKSEFISLPVVIGAATAMSLPLLAMLRDITGQVFLQMTLSVRTFRSEIAMLSSDLLRLSTQMKAVQAGGPAAAAAVAGRRAGGGNVLPGAMYEVAEKGAELYTVNGRTYLIADQSGGYITPVSQTLGGIGTSANESINAAISNNAVVGTKTNTNFDITYTRIMAQIDQIGQSVLDWLDKIGVKWEEISQKIMSTVDAIAQAAERAQAAASAAEAAVSGGDGGGGSSTESALNTATTELTDRAYDSMQDYNQRTTDAWREALDRHDPRDADFDVPAPDYDLDAAIIDQLKGRRKTGGPVLAGGIYQVGENNSPELLKLGNDSYLIAPQSGMVVPSEAANAARVGNGPVGAGLNTNFDIQYVRIMAMLDQIGETIIEWLDKFAAKWDEVSQKIMASVESLMAAAERSGGGAGGSDVGAGVVGDAADAAASTVKRSVTEAVNDYAKKTSQDLLDALRAHDPRDPDIDFTVVEPNYEEDLLRAVKGRRQFGGGVVGKALYRVLDSRNPELLTIGEDHYLLPGRGGIVRPLKPISRPSLHQAPIPSLGRGAAPSNVSASYREGDIYVEVSNNVGYNTDELVGKVREAVINAATSVNRGDIRQQLRNAGRL